MRCNYFQGRCRAVVLGVQVDLFDIGQVLALGAIMFRGFGHLFAIKRGSVIPSTKCHPAGIVNACFWNCRYVAYLGHGVANPVLVLEGLDLSLD